MREFLTVILLAWFASQAHSETTLSYPGATGGILRFPNTNQESDEGNGFGEIWLKQGVQVWQEGDSKLQAFYLGNFVQDTQGDPWNNSTKHGIGLQYSMKPIDALELTFSARYDWYRELESDYKLDGWRFAIDYYYYRYWPADPAPEPDADRLLTFKDTVLKSYGTLATPGSLEEGDTNVVLTVGGEWSRNYQIGESDFLLTPFVDLHTSWDYDQNNYNNKAIPAVGAKVRLPIKGGELFAGVKLEADYRWVDDTLDVGPMAFVGWYKGW